MDRVAFRLKYHEGFEARDAGESHLANPHPMGSDEHEAWLRGWGKHPDRRISEQYRKPPTRRKKR